MSATNVIVEPLTVGVVFVALSSVQEPEESVKAFTSRVACNSFWPIWKARAVSKVKRKVAGARLGLD